MSVYLQREETVTDIESLRSTKKSHNGLTVISDGITYKLTDDYRQIEVISPTGEATLKTATVSHPKYIPSNVFSNGVVWRGDAYFMSKGVLWALNLAELSWRLKRPDNHIGGSPLWEISTKDDLLLLTDESKGILSFSRFRPTFDDCMFIIKYTIQILSPNDNWEEILRARNTGMLDGIITIPWTLKKAMDESEDSEYSDVPLQVILDIVHIGEGIIPYPKSQSEASLLWRPFYEKEEEQEKINQLRERVSARSFSRKCPICLVSNPSDRAAFTACGHLCCLACAKQLALTEEITTCPLCRKETTFVRIYEEEEEANEINEEKVECVDKNHKDEDVNNELAKLILWI